MGVGKTALNTAGSLVKTGVKGAGALAGTTLLAGGGIVAFDAWNKTTGGDLAQYAQQLMTDLGLVAGESGANIQAQTMAEGLYANFKELGQMLSGFSAAMGLQEDLGVGIQNFSLAMMGQEQIATDVFGRSTTPMTFHNNNNDILVPGEGDVVTPAAEPDADKKSKTGADASDSQTSEGDAPADEENADVTPDEAEVARVDDSAPLVKQIDTLSNQVLTLAGNNRNIESPCGALKDRWAMVTDPALAGSLKTGIPAINPALEQCDIGAPS